MKPKKCFPEEVLAILRTSKNLAIRAGNNEHRFIGIWMVMVEDRIFVRSWSVKPDGWYRAFLKDARGAIKVQDRQIEICAVPAKSTRLRNAIDRAYLAKYNTPGSLRYAKDLGSAKSRATTIELVPF